jgi:hypothetical protein
MSKLIVGLAGKARSGKNYVGNVIGNNFQHGKVEYFSFAYHLRELVANVTSMPIEFWLSEDKKDKLDSDLSLSNILNKSTSYEKASKLADFIGWLERNALSVQPNEARSIRWWLQYYADYIKATHGLHYFAEYLQNKIYTSSCELAIVTDVRFQYEIELLEDINGVVIYVHNPDNNMAVTNATHSSEALTKENCKYVLTNVYGMSDDKILRQFLEILLEA